MLSGLANKYSHGRRGDRKGRAFYSLCQRQRSIRSERFSGHSTQSLKHGSLSVSVQSSLSQYSIILKQIRYSLCLWRLLSSRNPTTTNLSACMDIGYSALHAKAAQPWMHYDNNASPFCYGAQSSTVVPTLPIRGTSVQNVERGRERDNGKIHSNINRKKEHAWDRKRARNWPCVLTAGIIAVNSGH